MNRINNEIELRAPEEKIENQSKRFLNLALKHVLEVSAGLCGGINL